MSKVIEYIGKSATMRIVNPEDFKTHGVDHKQVVFNVVDIPTRGQAEVSDAAADMLMELEPGNFREVPEDKRAMKFRRSDSDASGTGQKGTGKE